MLKIMKYDWKNGWNSIRILLPIAAVLSALTGFLLKQFDDHAVLLVTVWFAVMVALLVLTVNAIFRNLSGRMFGPEGYLTHTLPVKTWELLLGKAAGTWLFGLFMLFAAISCWLLLLASSAVVTSELLEAVYKIIEALPKLGAYHMRQLAVGMGYLVCGLFAFAGYTFLLVMQFQFVCIAARLFGRFHIAGGIILFLVLGSIESIWNQSSSMGFLVVLISSAICFAASQWILQHRLQV